MIESVALELLVEAAKPMIEVLVSRVKEEIFLIRGFKHELNKLQRKIQIISSILLNINMTATNTSSHSSSVGVVVSDKAVELWLRNTFQIIYSVEDMLDVLAYEKQRTLFMKRRPKRSSTGKLRFFFSPLNSIVFRHRIGRWIKKIDRNIEDSLKEARTIVELKALVNLASEIQPRNVVAQAADDRLQQLRQNVDMSLFVGRDSDVDSIVDKLCNPFKSSNNKVINRNLISVVTIIGFGGLGKTVLAKNIFEKKQVKCHFTERIWIVVSKDFDITRILNKMLEFVDRSHCGNLISSEMAVRKLKENLDGKRYLLVLDDVWNTHQDTWNAMKSSLQNIGGSNESMILVTTRDNTVAQTMHPSSVHRLPELSEADSWSLFKQVVNADNMSLEDISVLETTGKKIVKKCKGVPLAIKTIGGMLKTKKNAEWANIELSDLWDLPQDDTGILPSLKLSYNHLPSPFLKKCFSFCAIVPKQYGLGKQWLTCNWISLGLIQQSQNRNLMEDIAEGYIDALLSISFLHEMDRNEFGEISSYGMHDLVHDLARLVSTNELLLLEAGNQVEIMNDIRHLAMHGQVDMISDKWDRLTIENLRTLFIYGSLPQGIMSHVKYLRVLLLENLGLQVVPKSLAELKCLKCLSLFGNPIQLLPDFITKLFNLQILNLQNCELLGHLPRGLSNLVNLRHLAVNTFIHCPAGMIGKLSCLQTLPCLWVSEGGFQISELGCLQNISDLLILRGLELIKSKQEAESANLSEKSRVKRLSLTWDSDDNWIKHEEVLDGLFLHHNLRLLWIDGYGGEKFPSWFMRMDVTRKPDYDSVALNLLKFLNLNNCRRCQQLPTLGHLPALEKLEIRDMDSLECISADFYHQFKTSTEVATSSSNTNKRTFPSLKELQLCGLHNLMEWCEPNMVSDLWTSFPSLETLVIEDCVELITAPNNFPCLKQLIVKNTISSHPLLKIITNKKSLSSLRNLHIEEVVELTHVPEELIEYCTSLKALRIDRCQNLSFLPNSLSKLIFLEVLQIWRCPNLVSLPSLNNLMLLRELDIFDNEGLIGAPDGLQSCKSLEKLWFYSCPKVETLPDLTGFNRLSNLCIRSLTKMICEPPAWLYTLPYLRSLHIGDYRELNNYPDISFLLKIISLETLTLYGWEKMQSLPEQLQHFTALKGLGIADFGNLEYLPDWVGSLSSLQVLFFTRCRKLNKLPSMEAMQRLPKLRLLQIEDCPLLEDIVKVNGPEYYKIAHLHVKIVNVLD